MKIVIAADSFKGSLSSVMVGEAISEGIKRVFKQTDIKVFLLLMGRGYSNSTCQRNER